MIDLTTHYVLSITSSTIIGAAGERAAHRAENPTGSEI